jgi:two-component system chemotaxis sensor kinase CheA
MSWEEAQVLFGQEAEELLVEMEDALLALEHEPDNMELVNSLFRAMHTIKGAAGVFGFDPIVEFTHPIETEVDRLRIGERQIDPQVIAILLRCKDHTQNMVHHVLDTGLPTSDALQAAGEQILAELQASSGNAAPTGKKPPTDSSTSANAGRNALSAMFAVDMDTADAGASEPAPKPASEPWLIALDFKENALRNGLDPLSFIRYLNTLGQISQIISRCPALPGLDNTDFEACYWAFRIAFHGESSKEDIEAVFEFAQDDCDIRILPSDARLSEFRELLEDSNQHESLKLGELLISIGAITRNELKKSLSLQQGQSPDANAQSTQDTNKRLGEVLVEQNIANQPLVEQALKKQQQAREQAQTIRVDTDKLSQLINLVGELVISSAAMKILVDKHELREADEVVNGMEHLVGEIRDNALQLRMVPIGETFSRFRRVTSDVSRDLNKEIELVITGGESELDKNVVEKITDPLTHLVRNALDHGIETPSVRLAAGKTSGGQVKLNAFHDSGHIVIEIIDDGAGLDPDRIRAKAEAIGLVEPGQILSRSEVFSLAFEPGLSTKDKASNLSGRGVGMDVVKRNIEALRGTVELDSEPGQGTKVTIQLPLTLAIIDGFMVGAGSETYVIPLSMVEECVGMEAETWSEDNSRDYVNLRGELMPYLRLTDFFGVPKGEQPKRESLVVVRFGRFKAGFVVDQLFGEQQTVIKPLDKLFDHLGGVSGTTVLGTGHVALILDIQGLVTIASNRSKHRGGATSNTHERTVTSKGRANV